MNAENVIREYVVRELIYDIFDVTLAVDDNLLGPGLLDSLKILQLVHFVEQRFDIQIPQIDVTATKFGSISAIVDYLKQRKEQSAAN